MMEEDFVSLKKRERKERDKGYKQNMRREKRQEKRIKEIQRDDVLVMNAPDPVCLVALVVVVVVDAVGSYDRLTDF